VIGWTSVRHGKPGMMEAGRSGQPATLGARRRIPRAWAQCRVTPVGAGSTALRARCFACGGQYTAFEDYRVGCAQLSAAPRLGLHHSTTAPGPNARARVRAAGSSAGARRLHTLCAIVALISFFEPSTHRPILAHCPPIFGGRFVPFGSPQTTLRLVHATVLRLAPLSPPKICNCPIMRHRARRALFRENSHGPAYQAWPQSLHFA
jgi:hypothetical protein